MLVKSGINQPLFVNTRDRPPVHTQTNQGEALYSINSVGIGYHQHELLYIINSQGKCTLVRDEIQPEGLMRYTLKRDDMPSLWLG